MGDQSPKGAMSVVTKLKPYLAMISLQFGYAGMYVISLVSLKQGMSHYVLPVYRHAVATLAIAPFALVLERKTRPELTFSTFLKIMMLSFLKPVLDQNLYYLGMQYTSATFASATVNALPAITFVMAVFFRLEKIKIKEVPSQAKILGTVVVVAGAMVMTLYKGPILDIFTRAGGHHKTGGSSSVDKNWVTGTLMLLSSCFGWAGFFILQLRTLTHFCSSFTLKQYPAELSLTTLICIMGTLEGAVVALMFERDMSSWAVGWDSRLLAPVYAGIVCSGIAFYTQGVVIKERGPVFVTAFSPLIMIITAVLGAIVLSEQIHLGSVIGAILVVIGLYTLVWGKSKDPLSSDSSVAKEKAMAHELPIVGNSKSDITEHKPFGTAGKSKIPSKFSLSEGP
ncbi:EamA domain [Dillenia turbinata]|uniref:WAT1-related protein n=1 Tax=Dillenia turbinata TaxID=194707 RepID=A0AAN8VY54_9MAGN